MHIDQEMYCKANASGWGSEVSGFCSNEKGGEALFCKVQRLTLNKKMEEV